MAWNGGDNRVHNGVGRKMMNDYQARTESLSEAGVGADFCGRAALLVGQRTVGVLNEETLQAFAVSCGCGVVHGCCAVDVLLVHDWLRVTLQQELEAGAVTTLCRTHGCAGAVLVGLGWINAALAQQQGEHIPLPVHGGPHQAGVANAIGPVHVSTFVK
jgi:hypothetical protein